MDKKISNYSFQEIYEEDTFILIDKMMQEFKVTIPDVIETTEDLKEAAKILSRLSSSYSYLIQLSSYGKILVRSLKQSKAEKQKIDDAIDKRDMISNLADIMKMHHGTISRMITIKQQINYELKMSEPRY